MIVKNYLKGISGRVFVYVFGFLLTLTISNALSVNEFGRYSSIQATIELLTIIGSGGLAVPLTTLVMSKGNVFISSVMSLTWPYIVFSQFLMFMYAYNVLDLGFETYILCSFGLFVSVIWTFAIYTVRGIGFTGIFISEPAARSAATIVVMILFIVGSASVIQIILLNTILQAASAIFLITVLFRAGSMKNIDASLRSTFVFLMAGVFGYLANKGDIMILSLYASSDFIANYKISFLLAELPFQIVQSLLIMYQSKFTHLNKIDRKIYFSMIVISLICLATILIASPIINMLFFPNYSIFLPVLFLSLYFFIYNIQFPYDLLLHSMQGSSIVVKKNLFLCLLKITGLGLVSNRDPWLAVYLLPLIALLNFVVAEILFITAFKKSPLQQLLKGTSRIFP